MPWLLLHLPPPGASTGPCFSFPRPPRPLQPPLPALLLAAAPSSACSPNLFSSWSRKPPAHSWEGGAGSEELSPVFPSGSEMRPLTHFSLYKSFLSAYHVPGTRRSTVAKTDLPWYYHHH